MVNHATEPYTTPLWDDVKIQAHKIYQEDAILHERRVDVLEIHYKWDFGVENRSSERGSGHVQSAGMTLDAVTGQVHSVMLHDQEVVEPGDQGIVDRATPAPAPLPLTLTLMVAVHLRRTTGGYGESR